MNKYLALYAAKSSFSFDIDTSRYVFQLDNIQVSLMKIKSEEDKIISGFSFGWFIEIIIGAETLEAAISQSYDISEFFLSTLSLETGIEVHKSKLILAYDNSDGRKDREFRQFFYDMPFSRPQKVSLEVFKYHLEAIATFGQKTKEKERLYRAIRWFRKGILEDDPLDQFSAFWQGLETLNPLITMYYDCPSDENGKIEIEKKCSRTGETFYEKVTQLLGIEALAKDLDMYKDMKEIKGIRNGISHGYKGFSSLYNDCTRLSPIVAKMLHHGITEILGFTYDEKVLKHISNIAPIKVGESQFIDLIIRQSKIEELPSIYSYPFVVMNHIMNHVENDSFEGGHQVESSFTFQIGCITNVEVNGLGASGRGTKMELVDFGFLY